MSVMDTKNKIQGPYGPLQSHVYFVQDERTGLIKIGTSGNIRERIRNLESKYKTKLKFMGRLNGRTETEKQLHKRFWQYHHSGEWFTPAQELLEFIENHAVATLPELRPTPKWAKKEFSIPVKDNPLIQQLLDELGLGDKPIALMHITVNYRED